MAKIAILSFYSGLVERGVETFAYEMARRVGKKHSVDIFQAGRLPQTISGEKATGFKIVKVRCFASSPKSPKGLLSKIYLDLQSQKILLFSILAFFKIFKERYDVIIPLNGGWQTAIFRLISKIRGSKLLISGHAGIGADDAWNILFRPDVFVALTKTQETWARRLAPELNVAIIPNGVDLFRFNPKIQSKALPLKKPIVVCASALVPYKRVDLTVKAVAKAKDLSLLVLGDGELRGTIDGIGKRLLGDRYLRVVAPYSEIPSYYRAGQVFTLASETEAFGITYLEAMACNLPVVTTSDDSRASIIGRAGILTNPKNTELYARDLNIATKTNYRNIPYSEALKFSWNKIAKHYLDLIATLTK